MRGTLGVSQTRISYSHLISQVLNFMKNRGPYFASINFNFVIFRGL